MSSLFPDLFFFGPFFAPVLLRAAAAVYFLLYARSMWLLHTQKGKYLAFKDLVIGLLLLVGAFTQLVALVGIVHVFLRGMWFKKERPIQPLRETAVIVAILLALVLMGAGAFAIDLPY